jgi:hypothetical protein
MIRVGAAAALGLAIYVLRGQPLEAGPFEARIEDAETHLPLDGVVVSAAWEVAGFGIEGGRRRMLVIRETVSGSDGIVRFPGWGPIRVGLFTTPSVLNWPELTLFKRGYRPLKLTNSWVAPPGKHISDHDGSRINLVPFHGDKEQWAQELHKLEDYLNFIHHSFNDCEWKHIPRMLRAFVQEGERVGVPVGTSLEDIARPERCGSLLAYIREQPQ